MYISSDRSEEYSRITKPMEEEAWENWWHLHMEMDCEDDFFDKCQTDGDDEFLRDILQLEQENPPVFSSESESDHSFSAIFDASSDGVVLTSEVMMKSNYCSSDQPRRSYSPRTYNLSFDNSTVVPVTPEPSPKLSAESRKRYSDAPNWASEIPNTEPRSRPNNQGGPKRTRNSSQTMDHIMAERKRRQELTERFIALSATIPGLNKTDKASVLRAAIDYVKQLKERVQELEKQEKKKGNKESVIVIKKHALPSGNEENSTITSTTSETSSDECCVLPEMEARVLGKEVLVEIHCEKQIGIELKILDYLENLHLFVTATSVLPFGNSALCITIIAQMGEAYKMTVNELVKSLRRVVLKSHTSDPY